MGEWSLLAGKYSGSSDYTGVKASPLYIVVKAWQKGSLQKCVFFQFEYWSCNKSYHCILHIELKKTGCLDLPHPQPGQRNKKIHC